MSFRNTTWTTRDGRTLAVKDMSFDHLVNTRNLIKRITKAKLRARELTAISLMSCVQGEMAQDAIESETYLIHRSLCDLENYLLKSSQQYRSITKEIKLRTKEKQNASNLN